jgi:hypothetical protein
MSCQGEFLVGVFPLSADTRLRATRYSANAYRAKYLDPDLTSDDTHASTSSLVAPFCTYHAPRDLSVRGTVTDRARFLQDIQAVSVCLTPIENQHVKQYLLDASTSSIPSSGPVRQVLRGLAYP